MNVTEQMKKIELTTADHREVTGGINGYPVPVEGVALFADTIEDLKALAGQYESAEIHEFHWKNGWHNCEDKGQVSEYDLDKVLGWNIDELDKSNCDSTVMDVRNWDRDQWLENEADCFGDEWPEHKAAYDALADEIEALRKDNNAVAVELYGREVIDWWDNGIAMMYGYDSKNYRLGVLLSKSDGWEYTVNYNSFEIIDEDED